MIPMSHRLLFMNTFLIIMLLAFVRSSNAQINPNDYSYPVVTQSEYYIFRLVTVVDGLQHPWSLDFLPNGDMLIVERQGRLRIVRNGVLDPEPIPGIPTVWYTGNMGLLDVAVHPDFETNGLIYFTYAKPSADGSQGALTAARGRFDGRRLTDVEDIFVANAWGERPFHIGSRIAIDNNGYVFISTGDRQLVSPDTLPLEENPAQDLSSHAGSIMRVHEDGRVPSDNPFVDTPGAQPEIWSYGHRNVQGLQIDRETGELWTIEHGPSGGDELNLIQKGHNYGWPVIHYGTGRLNYNSRVREGMEQPVEFWTPSIAPAGLMIYYGDKFPKWRGHVFVGALRHHNLHRLERTQLPDGRYTIGLAEDPPMLPGIGRIRDLVEGPDGYIYLVMDDHRTRGRTTPILRMEPVEEIEFNPHYHPLLYGDEGGQAGRN